jgi:hypothetical protein
MRRSRWAWAGIVALALSGSARAQTSNYSSALTGIKPSDVQFKQVDISGALRAPNGVVSTGSSNGFSLSNFFRKLMGPSPTPVMGRSNIPSAQYPSAVMPLPPVSSTVPR